MADGSSLVSANLHFLKQGMALLQDIDDELYRSTNSPHFNSGVGKHFRHILDHYLSLTEYRDERIDYDARQRDERIENDRAYAIGIAEKIISDLKIYMNNAVRIESKVKVRSNEGSKSDDSPWSDSTIKRELQFLISHTVHHYALIAIVLRIQGYQPHEDFGVAPSTLRYQKERLHGSTE